MDLLPARVGAPLSIANLRQDLEVDHKTVERWLGILENLYVCFRVAPLGAPRIRAVKKERKLYLWDWSAVAEPGPRFENLVACQLLKYCHHVEDTLGHAMELRFLRDTDKSARSTSSCCVTASRSSPSSKSGAQEVAPAVRYFAERVGIPQIHQVHRGTRHFQTGRIHVVPYARFCDDLLMP